MNIQGEKQHNLLTKKNVEITSLQVTLLTIFIKKKEKNLEVWAIECTIISEFNVMVIMHLVLIHDL